MKEVYKTKSQIRTETADALEQFLAAGGKIEIVKSRKAPKTKMKTKNSRGFNGGTSGFARGFPSRSL